jgi:hypothetical protein
MLVLQHSQRPLARRGYIRTIYAVRPDNIQRCVEARYGMGTSVKWCCRTCWMEMLAIMLKDIFFQIRHPTLTKTSLDQLTFDGR